MESSAPFRRLFIGGFEDDIERERKEENAGPGIEFTLKFNPMETQRVKERRESFHEDWSHRATARFDSSAHASSITTNV